MGKQPIFVISLPRSGSTIIAVLVSYLTRKKYQHEPESFMFDKCRNELLGLSVNEDFVDKSINNLWFIDQIRLKHRNAKFVVIKRPMKDIIFSKMRKKRYLNMAPGGSFLLACPFKFVFEVLKCRLWNYQLEQKIASLSNTQEVLIIDYSLLESSEILLRSIEEFFSLENQAFDNEQFKKYVESLDLPELPYHKNLSEGLSHKAIRRYKTSRLDEFIIDVMSVTRRIVFPFNLFCFLLSILTKLLLMRSIVNHLSRRDIAVGRSLKLLLKC